MAIYSLVGATITLMPGWTYSGGGRDMILYGIADGSPFEMMLIGMDDSGTVTPNIITVIGSPNQIFGNEDEVVFEITGGSSATNQEVIRFWTEELGAIIEGGIQGEVAPENLLKVNKTVYLPAGWTLSSKYAIIYTINGKINGVEFNRLYMGYSSTSNGSANRIYYRKTDGTYSTITNTSELLFDFSETEGIENALFTSWAAAQGAIVDDFTCFGKGPVQIGNEVIKVIRQGSDLVKEVYSGNCLIYRAFHNYIEGYSTYALPPQGNGSKLILPAYTGENPPGEYFECYIYTEDGSEYYPGDEFIYPDDPEIAEYNNIGFDNQETPYYYPEHFMAQYSSNPSTEEPEPGETCYGEVRVSGFDVNIAGNRVGVGNSINFTGDYQQSFNYTINDVYRFGGFTNTTTGLSYVGIISLDAAQAYSIPSWRPNATNGAASAPSTVSVTQSRTITLNSSYVIQEWFCLYRYNGKYYI